MIVGLWCTGESYDERGVARDEARAEASQLRKQRHDRRGRKRKQRDDRRAPSPLPLPSFAPDYDFDGPAPFPPLAPCSMSGDGSEPFEHEEDMNRFVDSLLTPSQRPAEVHGLDVLFM